MDEYAIIVAGGKGMRMRSDIPKQFMLLAGIPVLVHTLRRFTSYSKKIKIILGLPEEDVATWKTITDKYPFDQSITLVKGGKTRFQTVKNCLNAVDSDGLVAIHDGVRPLIDPEIIRASFSLASVHGSAVTSVRLKESIRKTTQDKTQAVDRSQYRSIQTPQTFSISLIRKAYEVEEESWMTDDASVAEAAGHTISLFEGDYNNIKITTPSDLIIAEALLSS